MNRLWGLALLLSACGGAQSTPGAPVASPASPAGTTDAPRPAAVAASATAAASAPPPASAQVEPPTAPASAASSAPADVPASLRAIVDAPDRTPQDRALDAGRHPGELLAFASIAPGMHVADIQAGGGYTTELLARAVGPKGLVYSQNNKGIVERFAAKPWSERLAKPVLKNVVRVERELESPLPPEAKDLDAVIDVLFYHDTVWLGADRDKMNQAIFRALRPGGEYVIVDHSAKAGSGVREVKTLHRIEEKSVIDEVTRAGFRLQGHADFLRNPSDARDWNDSPLAAAERRGTSDRFVLRFVRP